jgi:hypothetical protein
MCVAADAEVITCDPALAKASVLRSEALRVDDCAIAHDTDGILMQDAGGNEVEFVLLLTDDDSVAGVVAALIADNEVRLFGEKVGHFALALIAPLRSNNYLDRHSNHHLDTRK